MDEPGLVIELFDLGIVGVDEIDNLLDGRKACGGEADMGLHVGKVCEELVNLSEAGVAIEGVDVVGREQDGSRVWSGEGHVDALTMVGVMS